VNVWVSAHAADRFAERVRPGMARRDASVELARLIREYGREVPWPEWCHAVAGAKGFAVELCDGVIAVLEPSSDRRSRFVVVTVKVRGGSGEGHVHRGQERRSRRRGRRVARDMGGDNRSVRRGARLAEDAA
jgi:hypothetical protein